MQFNRLLFSALSDRPGQHDHSMPLSFRELPIDHELIYKLLGQR